jgi:hypothetical protein
LKNKKEMSQTAIDLIISKLEELKLKSARKELQGRNAEYRIALYEAILICEEVKQFEAKKQNNETPN